MEASKAKPGHSEFKRLNIGFRPVVLSSDRFNSILSRSRQENKRKQQADVEEQQRYNQALKDGGEALCQKFTNLSDSKAYNDDELLEIRDKSLFMAAKEQRAAKLLEEMRKERIMRANRILSSLKPGQRALQQALLTTEMIHQRDYYQALKCEFAEEERRQQRLDEEQCPEQLIPFGRVTVEDVKEQQLAKLRDIREYNQQDFEARRQRREAEKQQEILDCIVEREQYKCLQEKEEKAAKELAQRRREFCRHSYEHGLKEKAEKAKYERMCDDINDRVICVDRTMTRNLDARTSKEAKELRAKRIQNLEALAIQHCQNKQAKIRQMQKWQDSLEKRGEADSLIDEQRRQCEIERLSKERRVYEREQQMQLEEQRQKAAEIRRFEIAQRYKNEEANKHFDAHAKLKHDKISADLKEVLLGQRKQSLDQRQEELMRVTACVEDPYLTEDVAFFNSAVQIMQESKKVGRPLVPIAKAVETYKRKNQVDLVPEGQMVRRSKRRDKCWPGFFSKAALAYKKYEHREKCKREQEVDRHKIFENCIKITKMAAEERPFKRCTTECPVQCKRHRGLPDMESVDSFEPPGLVCYEEVPPSEPCPVVTQTKPVCKKCGDGDVDCLCPSIMEVMKPGEEYPSSKSSIATKKGAVSQAANKDVIKSVSKTESGLSLAYSKRVSGGKQPSMTKSRNISKANTNLNRYLTAKPQPKSKAMPVQPNYPIISLIETSNSLNSKGNSKSAYHSTKEVF